MAKPEINLSVHGSVEMWRMTVDPHGVRLHGNYYSRRSWKKILMKIRELEIEVDEAKEKLNRDGS